MSCPDELLISGESHIRNYLEGQRHVRQLGTSMNLGYLPDSFGHPSQLPQILAGLGMNEIVFWRGLGPEITRTELTWAGKDGTEILGVNLPFSYGVAACMPDEPEPFVERLKLKLGLLQPLTDGDAILLMNGVDHVAPQRSFAANLRLRAAEAAGLGASSRQPGAVPRCREGPEAPPPAGGGRAALGLPRVPPRRHYLHPHVPEAGELPGRAPAGEVRRAAVHPRVGSLRGRRIPGRSFARRGGCCSPTSPTIPSAAAGWTPSTKR